MTASKAWNATPLEPRLLVVRSGAMALTLILHLVLYIWVTAPRGPRETPESEPLHLVFVKLPESKPLPAPQPIRINPMHTPVALPKHAMRVTTSSVPVQPTAPPATTPPIPDASQESPEPEAVPYGNNRFEQALTDSHRSAPPRIPGADEPVKVAEIHVQTAPSIAEIISDVGHVLRCKDALFKSRMTDEELARRGLTERQMLMEYSELGCHP